VEEVAIEVMKSYMVIELFQTMLIVSLNMGKFDSGGKYFEDYKAKKEREKVVLQEELDKERDF